MLVKDILQQNDFKGRLLLKLAGLENGQGLTKTELALSYGYRSDRVVEKWMMRYPEIRKHIVYILSGGTRITLFVNLNYRKELIDKKLATEKF